MAKAFQDTIKWYDLNAHEYAKASFPYFYDKEIEDFVALLPKGGRVLDAGCGGGRDCKRLLDKGLKPVGLDISRGLIDYCTEHYPYVKFIEGNFLHIPFPEESFEGVWAHASLLHLETAAEVKKALEEFYRVLTKGGILHVQVKAQKGERKIEVMSEKESKHERFFQYFKKEELEGYLIEAGFEIEKIEQFREIERIPQGRLETEWITILTKKKKYYKK